MGSSFCKKLVMISNLYLNKISIILALLSISLGAFFLLHPSFIETSTMYENLFSNERLMSILLIICGVILVAVSVLNVDILRFTMIVIFVFLFSFLFYTFLFKQFNGITNSMWIWSLFYIVMSFTELKRRDRKNKR